MHLRLSVKKLSYSTLLLKLHYTAAGQFSFDSTFAYDVEVKAFVFDSALTDQGTIRTATFRPIHFPENYNEVRGYLETLNLSQLASISEISKKVIIEHAKQAPNKKDREIVEA